MNARDLHAYFAKYSQNEWSPENYQTILRALALLAAVDESSDGLVRELGECQKIVGNLCSEGRCPKMSVPVREEDEDMRLTRTMEQAKARIVGLEKELASVKAERDALKAAFRIRENFDGSYSMVVSAPNGACIVMRANGEHANAVLRAAHPKDTP